MGYRTDPALKLQSIKFDRTSAQAELEHPHSQRLGAREIESVQKYAFALKEEGN